jgi:hypothetical protein
MRTPPVFWPLLLLIQAGAYAQAGRQAEGLDLVDGALEMVGRGAGETVLPQFYLLKGDLLHALPGERAAEAESWFERALEVAHGLDARMPELQAAVRLHGIRRDQGRAREGDRVLRAIYDTFTEGFGTADLTEAAALIGNARGSSGPSRPGA